MKEIFIVKISYNTGLPSYPLLYLGASLKNDNIPYRIFHIKPDEIELLLNEIEYSKPEIIIFSLATDKTIFTVYNLMENIKSIYPNIKILCGGPHISLFREHIFNDMPFDYGCIGFGENFINDFVSSYKENIENLNIFRNNKDKFLFLNESLDNIDDFIISNSDIKTIRFDNKNSFPLITSRGCPYNCGFCYAPILFKNKWIPHSIDWVIDYWNRVNSIFHPDSIEFWDDHFFIDIDRSIKIIETINKPWAAEIRADFINEKIADFAQKSKCKRLFIGAETGNQAGLNTIDKNIGLEQIESSVSILNDYKINVDLSFIIGFPFDTKNSVDNTLKFIKKLFNKYKNVNASIKLYTPYPNTALWKSAVEKGFPIPKSRKDYIKLNRLNVNLPWITEKERTIAIAGQYAFVRLKEIRRKMHFLYSHIANYRVKHNFYKIPLELYILKLLRIL